MPGTDVPEVFAAQLIFWILLPFVLFSPPRWAVLAWLVMGNLDATGPAQSASGAIGWINAAKGVLLPLYLWWRVRQAPGEVAGTSPARLWLMLTGYAAVASLWSPFPLPAVKLVGNMVGLLLAIIVLEKAARKGLFRRDTLTILVVSSLCLGVIQTYYFAGTSYGFDGTDEPLRFSSFVAAQQYGAFLVAFLALVLWHDSLGTKLKCTLTVLLCTALALNGSRTWFVGAAIVSCIYLWLSSRRSAWIFAFALSTVTLAVLLIVNLSTFDVDILTDTSSRIVATLSAIFAGKDTAHNAGLRNLSFRFLLYQGALSEIRSSTTSEILLGHGTSSGGNIPLHVFPTHYSVDKLDANRAIHNEWLRAYYEWGVLGLSLWIGVFGSLFAGLIVQYRKTAWKTRASAVLSFLPAFLAALATENVIAGAGNAVTLSFAMMIGLLWDPTISKLRAAGGPIVRA